MVSTSALSAVPYLFYLFFSSLLGHTAGSPLTADKLLQSRVSPFPPPDDVAIHCGEDDIRTIFGSDPHTDCIGALGTMTNYLPGTVRWSSERQPAVMTRPIQPVPYYNTYGRCTIIIDFIHSEPSTKNVAMNEIRILGEAVSHGCVKLSNKAKGVSEIVRRRRLVGDEHTGLGVWVHIDDRGRWTRTGS